MKLNLPDLAKPLYLKYLDKLMKPDFKLLRIKVATLLHDALQEMQTEWPEYIKDLQEDKKRLDWLDKANQSMNKSNNSGYGWAMDWNHNRIAITDSHYPKHDIRRCIDEAMKKYEKVK